MSSGLPDSALEAARERRYAQQQREMARLRRDLADAKRALPLSQDYDKMEMRLRCLPEGFLPMVAYTDGQHIIILGEPPGEDVDPQGERHNCAVMGCSVEHVLARLPHPYADLQTTEHAMSNRDLSKIGEEIRTQDNLGTSHPMFGVQEYVRDYGFTPDYTDKYEWRNSDGEPVDDDDHDARERVYYKERWEFVTMCFTRVAAQQYIDANRHNLVEPRIYVYSACGNQEWQA